MNKISAYDICSSGDRSKEPEFVKVSEFDDYAQGCQREIMEDRKRIAELDAEISELEKHRAVYSLALEGSEEIIRGVPINDIKKLIVSSSKRHPSLKSIDFVREWVVGFQTGR